MIHDAEAVLRIAGIGSYLHVGCGQSSLVFELLKRSMDAYGLDANSELIHQYQERAPERFFHGSLQNFPFKQTHFDTVIIGSELFSYQVQDLLLVFKALRHIALHHLILYFPTQPVFHYPDLTNRLFWEKLAIQAGFRLHPRSMLVMPYEELENENLGRFIFFECIPEQANQNFSMEWLLKNRDLHMDMLRESGRRSDAHVSRYVLASTQIRPGDVVLDAACGLGYGTAVLAACSPGSQFIGVDIDAESIAYANANYATTNPAITYQACDVTQLSFLEDHSIDTIISFETIEHVPDYDKLLAEMQRVLKPDGRFIGSVPNLWCDETGKDPNPYHFHVFDWEKLKNAVGKYFIVDGRWSQIAGGGFRLRDGKRKMTKIDMKQKQEIESEWWIISACANPLAKTTAAYRNPFNQNKDTTAPSHVDFEKYYDNPWLYRVMVQLGERIADQQVLVDFCTYMLEHARFGSADQGAAMCVIGYQLLESGHIAAKEVEALITLINAYDNAYDKTNPHAYRWAISLHYVGARLLLALGKRSEAMMTFMTCANMDPLLFSPLLATKTLSARMYAGLLCLSADNKDEAKNQLRLAIKETQRVLQGNWDSIVGNIDNPLPFGLQETAEIVDIAAQCSQLLHALERQGSVPGYIWDKVNLRRFGLVEWNKSLERENIQLRKQLSS